MLYTLVACIVLKLTICASCSFVEDSCAHVSNGTVCSVFPAGVQLRAVCCVGRVIGESGWLLRGTCNLLKWLLLFGSSLLQRDDEALTGMARTRTSRESIGISGNLGKELVVARLPQLTTAVNTAPRCSTVMHTAVRAPTALPAM